MKMEERRFRKSVVICLVFFVFGVWVVPGAFAQVCDPSTAPPGGSLNPCDVPKYEIPLVIPPVMNQAPINKHYDDKKFRGNDNYDIAVRQFQQQILPGGIWFDLGLTSVDLPATTVWSYGPAADPTPAVAPDPNSQFNYPAYTIETKSYKRVDVRWINELVANPDDWFLPNGEVNPYPTDINSGNSIPHIVPIDQTVHWANPPKECRNGPARTDCAGVDQGVYDGPVPIVTHVHGAHVGPESDGYPEAWWLPKANNIPAGYATSGTLFDDVTGTNTGDLGYVDFSYPQDQPATTLWYHDHSLGMTRNNVYAGPAGFWLIRGGKNDEVDNVRTRRKWDGILPGPAPVAGDTVLELNAPGVAGAKDKRRNIREIPIVIQDRSFNEDGSLFYPVNRAFFEGLGEGDVFGVPGDVGAGLDIPFAPDSDVLPTWNPEAFFNVMVVNGVAWPSLDVAKAIYRFRLLNGCNSRFLNLALEIVDSPWPWLVGKEIPFYQIGAEQGFLPKVVEVLTGFATALPGDGKFPTPSNRMAAPDPAQALIMGLAERADVLVDFRFLPHGTKVRMINTAPDEPFGGGFDPPADPGTTGQVLQFMVNKSLFKFKDLFTTAPWALKLKAERELGMADNAGNPRNVSLNEAESEVVLVCVDPVTEEFAFPIVAVNSSDECPDEFPDAVPFGPTEALLGTVDLSGADPAGNPLKWTDDNDPANKAFNITLKNGNTAIVNVTENPALNSTEEWDIYNFTVDAHPIHLHLVRFEVISRTVFDPATAPPGFDVVQPWEAGFKDTVIAYPGHITKVKAKFDVEGLYVWHCHIVEHEDNEMMRPYFVGDGDV